MMLVWLRMVCLKELWSQANEIHLLCRLLLPKDIWWKHYISTLLVPAFGFDFDFLKDLFILSNIPETIVLVDRLFPSTALVREYLLRDLMIIWLNLLHKMWWYQFLSLYNSSRRSRSMITRIRMAYSDCALWRGYIIFTSLEQILMFSSF